MHESPLLEISTIGRLLENGTKELATLREVFSICEITVLRYLRTDA
jgi:hypothetical protein